MNHDHDPHNDGTTHAPQVRYMVHPNIMQADAIGHPLANADACSNVGSQVATMSKGSLEAMACAVEHIGTPKASSSKEDGGKRMRLQKLRICQCKNATEEKKRT
jgi:hypothetical protein